MKYLLLLTFSLFALSLKAQKKLPSVEVKTLDGKIVNIQDYTSGSPLTILSFWASWCSNCKKELNAIAEYYPDWQADFNLQLVAVTIDDQRTLPKAKPIVSTSGWEYVILSDVKQELMKALNFQAIPQTFVVDQKGNIIYEHTGYSPGTEFDLEDFLKEATKK